MKLMNYKKVLKMGKEKIADALAPIRANQAKIQANLEISKMQEEIATKEMKIQEICVEHPLNFHKLMDIRDEISLLVRRVKHLQQIIKELFDEDCGEESA